MIVLMKKKKRKRKQKRKRTKYQEDCRVKSGNFRQAFTSCASRSLVGLRRIITFAREATTLKFLSIHSS